MVWADRPRCMTSHFSPGFLELLLRKTRSYETLPKEIFLKLLEPQRGHSRKGSANKDYTKNFTFAINVYELNILQKISWIDHVRNEEVLLRVNEQRNILREIRK